MRAVLDHALAHSASIGLAFGFGLFVGLGLFIWLDAYASFGRVRR
jgi:hypothetical protein